jgi:hypothetical protein
MFFDSLLFDATSQANKSYNQMAIEVKSGYGVGISKQGIDQRFNEQALKYIQSLTSEQLSFQVLQTINGGWLDHFSRVIIKDSTKFDIPKELQDSLPGFGGCASPAGVCIQYEFDIKSGQVNDLAITPGKRPDSKDSLETIGKVIKGDLVIRDLGYFAIDCLKYIQNTQAYFISRLNPNVVVFQCVDNEFERIDFDALHQMMSQNKIERLEKQVYIGSKEKFPVRMVIELMPESVVASRLQKVNSFNKKKGRQTSKDYITRARFNIFITNISNEIIKPDAISKIYKIRWQVELIFKAWKSTFGIDNIGKMKYTRLMCLLNVRLLLILINWETFIVTRNNVYKKTGSLLSLNKCFKTLQANSKILRDILINGCKGLIKWFRWVVEIFQTHHWLEKKKNKVGLEEIMHLKCY